MYRKHRFQLFIVLVLVWVATGHSSLSSRTSSGWWNGGVDFTNHKMTVKVQGLYLDVEEEAQILVVGEDWGLNANDRNALEIFGEIDFPRNSAVVGLLLWNGMEVLKGKLKSTAQAVQEYEDVVDRVTAPPPAPRDPALLVRLRNDTYSLNIYPATLGAVRRIRIRYIVPRDPLSAEVALHPVLSTGLNTPQLVLEINGIEEQLHIVRNDSRMGVDAPAQVNLTNVQQFRLAFGGVTPRRRAMRTSFSGGEWGGHYMLLDLPLPDSLLRMANLDREVVVLWRWNFPEYYVDAWDTPTEFGWRAISQGQQIADAAYYSTMNDLRLRWGLVHQSQPGQRFTFAPAARGNAEFHSMLEHLYSLPWTINEMVPPYLQNPQRASNEDIRQFKDKGRADFDSLLRNAVTLFSPQSGVVKHVVVITAGPQFKVSLPGYEDLKQYTLDAGITMSGAYFGENVVYGDWPGVDLGQVARDREYAGTLNRWSSLPVPAPRSLQFLASFRWNGLNTVYTLPDAASRLTLALHRDTPPDSQLTWIAMEMNGEEVARIPETVRSMSVPRDTAVVKLVGAHPTARSTVFGNSLLGAAFGVVRTDYALVALESDGVGDSLSRSLEERGIPHLLDSEIFVPRPDPTSLQNIANNDRRIRLWFRAPGVLVVDFAPSIRGEIGQITILDLRGRKVAHKDSKMSGSEGGQQEFNLSHLRPGVYSLQLRMSDGSVSHRNFVLR